MRNRGHLQTCNHFSIVALDGVLFRKSWETAFGIHIPEIFTPSGGDSQRNEKTAQRPFFHHMPTYRGGAWPAGKYFGVEQIPVPPMYQPDKHMIECKIAGTMPSATEYYEQFGNGIQYFGIVEGENRDPFLRSLKESYGCEKLEEMFYDPLPGDFCIVETRNQLGFNLCVKKDGALNGLVHVILPETVETTVVVDHLEEAVDHWSDIFDINKPEIRSIEEDYIVSGEKVSVPFKVARIDEAPFVIYLAEDHKGGPFSKFSEIRDQGIHHLTFDHNKLPEGFGAHLKEALDINIMSSYDLDGYHYTIYDSIDKMGAYIAERSRCYCCQAGTI